MKPTTSLTPDPSSLVEILRTRALHQPDRLAYIFLLDGEKNEHRLTYAELDLKARAVAAYLESLDAQGQRVLLIYDSGWEFVAAFFGCLYAGAVPVPTHKPRPNRSLLRLQSIVTNSQAHVALTTSAILTKISDRLSEAANVRGMRWVLSDTIPTDLAGDWRETLPRGDDLAFIQYTSGSTAEPRGVMISHQNILHNERMIQLAFEHNEDSIALGWLPLFHDMGLIGKTFQPLYGGFPGVLMPPLSFLQKPLCWLQAISKYRATTSGAPNFAYDFCLRRIQPNQLESLDLSSWRVAFCGSEPNRAETLEKFALTFAACGFKPEAFYPCYGLAEATLIVSGGRHADPLHIGLYREEELKKKRAVKVNSHERDVRRIVSCGKILDEQRAIIVDPDSLSVCREREIGELWISGASVSRGYWNKPEKTAATFGAYLNGDGDGPYLRTGDLGFFDDGDLFITGRLKDLIIIRGQNFSPEEIELVAQASHVSLQYHSSAAFMVEENQEQRLIVAHEVSTRPDFNDLEIVGAIREAIVDRFDLRVDDVVLLRAGDLPKTSSGKIQRHVCQNDYLLGTLRRVSLHPQRHLNDGQVSK